MLAHAHSVAVPPTRSPGPPGTPLLHILAPTKSVPMLSGQLRFLPCTLESSAANFRLRPFRCTAARTISRSAL
eukprot:4982697-Amphidinium_carterae.1